jgi:hypothetical protein
MFMSPGIESFAIIINGLFFAVMVPLAYEEKVDPSVAVFAGCVGALAYLNKLSYVYVPLALYAALIAKLPVNRAALLRGTLLHIVFLGTLVLVVFAAAFVIIGWDGFWDVWRYHQSIIWGSELYGTGDQTVVSKGEIWRAITAIPGDRAYAVPIALVGGIVLVIGGVVARIKQAGQAPVAVLSIGAGIAAVLSALSVLKHYDLHYTAGVSATLPACVVSLYLLARSWGLKFRFAGAALAATAVLLMAIQIKGTLIHYMQSRTNATAQAKADIEEINSYLAGSKRTVEFAYKAPFPQYGEGFIVIYGSVPRLTYDYFQSRPLVMSSMMASLVTRDVGAYVIDKSYFRDAESVKAAPNVALLDPKPVRFEDGDRLIELRTVFLLIRG